MSVSIWNHYFDYSFETHVSVEAVIDHLEKFYKTKNPKILDIDRDKRTLHIEKGSVIMSLFCIGPETWCKNSIAISVFEYQHVVKVLFKIHLKSLGFSIGTNYLIEEAKEGCERIGS